VVEYSRAKVSVGQVIFCRSPDSMIGLDHVEIEMKYRLLIGFLKGNCAYNPTKSYTSFVKRKRGAVGAKSA
jgi:hypothetical protein